MFIFSLFSGQISAPVLINNINIRIPKIDTRKKYLLLNEDKYEYDSPFSLMKGQFNAIFSIKSSVGVCI